MLGAGAVVGLVSGGPTGLVLAAFCLVMGLVLFVASETLGTKQKHISPFTTASTQTKAPVLVLVKEVHVSAATRQ